MNIWWFSLLVCFSTAVSLADEDGLNTATDRPQSTAPEEAGVLVAPTLTVSPLSDDTETISSNPTESEDDVSSSGEQEATVNGTDGQANTTAVPPNKAAQKKVKCSPRTKPVLFKLDSIEEPPLTLNEKSKEWIKEMEDLVPKVQLVNGTHLLEIFSEKHNPNVTNRSMPAECHLVIFYAPWCPFSAKAAPHFNALARIYPDMTLYAVDSSKHQGINTQFGIMAIPTVILFHNTKPVSKFNQTDYVLDNFIEFVDTVTWLKMAVMDIALLTQDFAGPMPTVAVPEPDYYLYLAWLFTIVCATGYFAKSSYCQRVIESIRNNWREAEIQHEHID